MSNLRKLEKVNDSFSVYRYDNGFMFEVSGRDEDDNYKTSKVICNTLENLLQLVNEYNSKDLVE